MHSLTKTQPVGGFWPLNHHHNPIKMTKGSWKIFSRLMFCTVVSLAKTCTFFHKLNLGDSIHDCIYIIVEIWWNVKHLSCHQTKDQFSKFARLYKNKVLCTS